MYTASLLEWILLIGITVSPQVCAIHSSDLSPHQSESYNQDNGTFDWNTIEPKEHLQFYSCYGDFQCARLDVPMNHDRTDGNGSRLAIAVTKYPAKVPVSDPRYGGAILTNPGGPGGSGVEFIIQYGKMVQKIVDASETDKDGKFFDIISWDPRGVGNTSPPLICFPHIQDKLKWQHVTESLSYPRPEDGTLDFHLARQVALATSCSSRLVDISAEEDSLIENMNTAAVVGDMVSIIEALGEWRELEAKNLLSVGTTNGGKTNGQVPIGLTSESEIVMARTKWNKGKEKLLYWGLSYGTVLGATFAAMEPKRVGRLIIDGVVDAKDYYESQLSRRTLMNTNETFEGFFKLCAKAGSKCPFSKPDSTAEDLKNEYQEIIANLTARPIPFYTAGHDMFDVLTAQDLRILIFQSLYMPLIFWNEIAIILNDLRHGNVTSLHNSKKLRSTPANWCPSGSCGDTIFSRMCKPHWEINREVTLAIMSTDADLSISPIRKPLEEIRSWLLDLWDHNRNLSSLAGDILSSVALGTAGWKGQAKRSFKVPDRTDTAYPLLLLGTTWDPVCPLANAFVTAKRFPGSVVMEQTSYGHCTLSSPSLCTAKVARNYFQTGELPEPGTVCDVNELPFVGVVESPPSSGFVTVQSKEDKNLLEALHVLRDSVVPLFRL